MSFITDPIISKPTQCILDGSIVLKVALLLGVRKALIELKNHLYAKTNYIFLTFMQIFRNVSTYAVALIQLDTVQESLANIGAITD